METSAAAVAGTLAPDVQNLGQSDASRGAVDPSAVVAQQLRAGSKDAHEPAMLKGRTAHCFSLLLF